jgi:uncharacterized protein (DUF4415 family)
MKAHTLDPHKKLTQGEIEMLEALKKRPIDFDEDSPELTEDQLKQFRKVSEIHKEERRKQSVTLRLSPRALRKARSLGKGYTSVLSRILEHALEDNELIEKYL